MIRTALASVAVFSLGGCAYLLDVPPAPEVIGESVIAPEPEVQIETKPKLPVRIEQNSEAAFSSAEFPEQLQVIAPLLDARLRAEARMEFEIIELEAQTYKAADPEYFRPYGLGYTWTLHQSVGDLVSLHGLAYYNTGGAHPNYASLGLIYDRASEQDLDLLDLFSDREAARARLVPLVRAEIVAQKRERYADRGMSDIDIIAEVADSLPDSGAWLAQSALAASDDGEAFGGIEVYFSPYELGSYAEGAYKARVSQAAFRDLLKPEYQAVFAGEPISHVQN